MIWLVDEPDTLGREVSEGVSNVVGNHKYRKYHKCKNCQYMCLNLLCSVFNHMYLCMQDPQTELAPAHIVFQTPCMGD